MFWVHRIAILAELFPVITLCLGYCDFVDSFRWDAFFIYLYVWLDIKCRNVGREQEKELFYYTLNFFVVLLSRISWVSVVKKNMVFCDPPLCLDNGGS